VLHVIASAPPARRGMARRLSEGMIAWTSSCRQGRQPGGRSRSCVSFDGLPLHRRVRTVAPGGMRPSIGRWPPISPPRNHQMITDVVEALGRGRHCLLLTRRTAHLESLAQALRDAGFHPPSYEAAWAPSGATLSWPGYDPARTLLRCWPSTPGPAWAKGSTVRCWHPVPGRAGRVQKSAGGNQSDPPLTWVCWCWHLVFDHGWLSSCPSRRVRLRMAT
jgi:hypothetical protein